MGETGAAEVTDLVSYTCENCKGTFQELPTREAEAQQEYARQFGAPEEHVRICHTCWLKFMDKAEKMGLIDSTWRKDL